MYSRNYYSEDSEFKIPEKYSGTLLMEEKENTDSQVHSHIEIPSRAESKISPPKEEKNEAPYESAEASVQKRGGFDITSLLSGSSPFIKSLIPKIELEEILLLSLAAFLLFSKFGDKECALIVLLLVFIK